MQDGLLKFQGKLYVEVLGELKSKLTKALYSSTLGGHFGQRACLQKLKSIFYWANMKLDIFSYISSCDVCQRNKGENIPYPGLLLPIPIPTQA